MREPGELETRSDSDSIGVQLARMEAKFDVAMATFITRMDSFSKDVNDHEARVRVLETRPYIRPAVMWTLIGIIVSIVGAEIALIGLR